METKVKKKSAFDTILDMLQERINQVGIITTDEAWKICNNSYSYTTVVSNFQVIMTTMCKQGKAIKIKGGTWKITKPDEVAPSEYLRDTDGHMYYKIDGNNTLRVFNDGKYFSLTYSNHYIAKERAMILCNEQISKAEFDKKYTEVMKMIEL